MAGTDDRNNQENDSNQAGFKSLSQYDSSNRSADNSEQDQDSGSNEKSEEEDSL